MNHINHISNYIKSIDRPLIHNTLIWVSMIKECVSLKPYYEKTLWDKNLMEKEYIILYNIVLFIFYFSPHVNLYIIKMTKSNLVNQLLKSSPWQRLCK